VPWGVKARVTVGAITRMSDWLTDIYVTYMFSKSARQKGYFEASLASLVVSMVLQLFIVSWQNKRLGIRRVLRECFPVLIGFKPAVDAYNVATGKVQEEGNILDPMSEMTLMKIIEMFAEAIPAVIIQLMAIVTTRVDQDVTISSWLSLATSALSTGFISATISYDFDTSPEKRQRAPGFYGYISAKASKRTAVFMLLMAISGMMLIIRCMTIVVLGLLGKQWVLAYLCIDFCLYFVIKMLRKDFWYWIPIGGNVEILSSIIMRTLVKFVTDFTSVVQFRHPNEVGGVYWAFGFVLTMGSLPVVIIFAGSQLQDRAISTAWGVIMHFIPGSLILFAFFFFIIEKKYWHTFLSTQKGKDLTMSYFLEGKSDVDKFEVLKRSEYHWDSIEKEVRKWVGENWARWEEEKPEWLTDAMKAKVPVEFIPTNGDARRKESVRRASVDAEAKGGLGGALRVSMRRASVDLGVGIGKARVVPTSKGAN
jgi:hypothetical protein